MWKNCTSCPLTCGRVLLWCACWCRGSGLTVLAFVHTWSPPALHVGKCLQQLSADGQIGFATVLYTDPETDPALTFELGYASIFSCRVAHRSTTFCRVVSTPALVFYRYGAAMKITRPDLLEDVKCTPCWNICVADCECTLAASWLRCRFHHAMYH